MIRGFECGELRAVYDPRRTEALSVQSGMRGRISLSFCKIWWHQILRLHRINEDRKDIPETWITQDMKTMVCWMNYRVWHCKNIRSKGNNHTFFLPVAVSKYHALHNGLDNHLISQRFWPVWIYIKRNSKLNKTISSSKLKN